jgi:O-antigen/teichoic acid export membrane protein
MRALSGLSRLFGFGLSMALLALASLVLIPVMIRSSGEAGWGAIALGQGIGGLGAVLVSYGWAMSGPSEIARGDDATRLAEFLGSLKVRALLLPATAVLATAITVAIAPVRPDLAAAGTVVGLLAALTTNWYFVGLAKPYLLLVLETLPRLAFTIVGIVVMENGADAIAGLGWQSGGLVAAFVASTWWILHSLRTPGSATVQAPKLRELLVVHGHGVASSLGSALYSALPMVVITLVAPLAQPMYALVDKLHGQVVVGLFPAIYVAQGWVPRAADPGPRARRVLLGGVVFCLLIAAGAFVFGPWLLDVLGAGHLQPGLVVVELMAVGMALHFYAEIVGHAVLATYRSLRIVAISIVVATVVGLPLVAVGAAFWGTTGALAAVNVGYLIRVVMTSIAARRAIRADLPVDDEATPVFGESVG